MTVENATLKMVNSTIIYNLLNFLLNCIVESKGSCRSTTKKNYEVKTVDKSSSDESEEEKDHKSGTFSICLFSICFLDVFSLLRFIMSYVAFKYLYRLK